MTYTKRTLVIISLLALTGGLTHAQTGTTSSSSQRVTPQGGTWAGGADLGLANPIGDDDFDADPMLDAYLEYFYTPHVSFRGMLGLMSFNGPDVPGFGSNDLDIAIVTANILYQWEGGTVHPFVTGGVGLYDYNPDFGDDNLELGINAGGGLNFYLARHFAIKVEGAFHATGADEPDSFFTATAGARWLWGS